ncbi:MAG: H/ACA ribonucleoprotein complex subunit GAR1 [Haloarculaceae archaeon]
MKRVGDVVRVVQGVAVVRCADDDCPDLGTPVVDESLDDRGRVVDVFGPVERPYVAVSTAGEPVATLLGTTLYAR